MAQWNAGDYHRHSTAQATWAAELLDKLALRGDEAVLDIGCGDGRTTADIASRVPDGRVVGVDNSPEMIGFARQAFPPDAHANLTFELQDARALGFSQEFDVVFSNAALHWVVDHEPVLRGISQALRPGGRLLLQMGGRGNAAAAAEVFGEVTARPHWAACFEGFSFPYGFHGPEDYRRWMAAAGLTPQRVELIDKDMAQDGIEGLAGWVRTTWMPYTSRVPQERRDALIAEVVERYAERHPADEQGRLHVGMVRLEVEGRK